MMITTQPVKDKISLFNTLVVKRIAILFLACIFFSTQVFSQEAGIPPRPNPPRLVNNYTSGFISQEEAARLEQKLSDFANKTSNQIVIVIVDDLNGYEPYAFATNLGQAWKVGQEKEDNGVVILVKPKNETGKGQVQIAPGYGLEGALPDATCKQIVENEMIPNFKNGNNYEGLNKATDVIMSLAIGEYNSDAYAKKHKKQGLPAGVIIAIVLIIFVVLIKGNRRNGGGGGMTMSSAGWLLGSILSSGGRGSGGFGGGSSGGGFGGFGGGSFGGGGAGGSW